MNQSTSTTCVCLCCLNLHPTNDIVSACPRLLSFASHCFDYSMFNRSLSGGRTPERVTAATNDTKTESQIDGRNFSFDYTFTLPTPTKKSLHSPILFNKPLQIQPLTLNFVSHKDDAIVPYLYVSCVASSSRLLNGGVNFDTVSAATRLPPYVATITPIINQYRKKAVRAPGDVGTVGQPENKGHKVTCVSADYFLS